MKILILLFLILTNFSFANSDNDAEIYSIPGSTWEIKIVCTGMYTADITVNWEGIEKYTNCSGVWSTLEDGSSVIYNCRKGKFITSITTINKKSALMLRSILTKNGITYRGGSISFFTRKEIPNL